MSTEEIFDLIENTNLVLGFLISFGIFIFSGVIAMLVVVFLLMKL
jgi:hypothetical protein